MAREAATLTLEFDKPNSCHHDLQILVEEQRGKRELAEHECDREDRSRQDRRAHVRHDDPGDHRPPACAQAPGRLGQGC